MIRSLLSDKPSHKVLICVYHPFDQWNAPPWFSERLRKAFPQSAVVHLPDYIRLDEEILDADVLMAWSIRPDKLHWQRSCAGFTLRRRR
jgi:hypothetical protein